LREEEKGRQSCGVGRWLGGREGALQQTKQRNDEEKRKGVNRFAPQHPEVYRSEDDQGETKPTVVKSSGEEN
jgi:hypothetical protein